MKKFWIVAVFLLGLSPLILVAQGFRVSGYVYDQRSKETLIGASIYQPSTKQGTTTNAYGFYSYLTKSERVTLEVSYIGYAKQVFELTLTQDTTIDVYLLSSSNLDEITVKGENQRQRFVTQEVIGKMEINPEIVTKMPTLMGESDLLKAIQMLPGVKSGTEGTSGLFVRGGNVDQNLYLIDGVEVYNPNHLFGFISTFNTDAIKSIDFYKGGFPAQYNSRVSSVMDIRTKDGNNEKIRGDFSIGLISAKLNLEGPIIKDKTTFNLSVRRTYMDILLKPLFAYGTRYSDSKYSFNYYFTDVNAKVKHRFDSKNSLSASFYLGNDTYGLGIKQEIEKTQSMSAKISWGNIIATLDYSHQFSRSLFGNLSASFNQYRSRIFNEYEVTASYLESGYYLSHYNFNSGVRDFTLRNHYNYYLNSYNSINCGVYFTHHIYTPEISTAYVIEGMETIESPFNFSNTLYANEITAYLEDVITASEKISIRAGLNYNMYFVGSTSYFNLMPRLSLRYSLLENLSVKAGYSRMNQNIHLLANGLFSLPTDMWLPVTERIKPIVSDQMSIGMYYNGLWDLDMSVEAYYKTLDNVIDYMDGVSSFSVSSTSWEELVAQGKGKAYGLEFSLQRSKGRVNGWLAYTLSWATRQYDEMAINNGEEFYDRFDVRHQLTAVVNFSISDRWELTSAFVLNSGARTNVPIGAYFSTGLLNESTPKYDYGLTAFIYGPRNNFQLPLYHRLDLGLSNKKPVKNGEIIWSFNVYNAYNHKNAFMVFESTKPHKLTAISVMPITPTVSFSYKFN